MKNILAIIGLALASSGLAQKWDAQGGKLTFIGCYSKSDGIYCDFSYILTKSPTASMTWDLTDFNAITPEGLVVTPRKMAFVDGKFINDFGTTSKRSVAANIPVKLQAYFELPDSLKQFMAVSYKDQKVMNIAIRSQEASAQVPAALRETIKVNGYTVRLEDCRLQGTDYTCTAKATPTK